MKVEANAIGLTIFRDHVNKLHIFNMEMKEHLLLTLDIDILEIQNASILIGCLKKPYISHDWLILEISVI